MAAWSAALVVHDLKNELGALEAGLEQLALRPEAGAASLAHRQCHALRQRLVMFLTVYGIDGELRAVCDDESPVEVIESLVARQVLRSPSISVSVRATDEAPPFWHFDRRLVTMALEAALHNALKFARSRVDLSVCAEGSTLVFAIDDDGPGIGPSTGGDDLATGLGTTLCRSVARAHGAAGKDGGVRLFNRRQGGARFELRLPT